MQELDYTNVKNRA